ncbi:MAG: hypothetical protein ABI317_09380 [Gaiellales bacterium]
MHVRPRCATGLVALLLVAVAASAAPASASPVTATIRVQGLAGTVIPTTTLQTDARPIVSDDFVSHQLAAPSALTLTEDAADAAGLSVSCTWSTTYDDCQLTGFPDVFTDSNDYWRLVVNGKDSPTGFAGTALRSGDRVDVIATDYTQPEAPLVTLALSSATVPDGTSFTVKVTSQDTSGFGTTGPAVGAVVSYGALQATTGADGTASFMGTGAGYTSLSATLDGATPSQVWSICAYGADPTVCSLPAPAVPPTPSAAVVTSSTPTVSSASVASADRIAPSSRFSAPLAFARVKNVKRLVGITAPDRSDIASVSYALAKRVGTLCSFRRANGTFAPASSCSKAIWLPATGRAFWHVTFRKPLAAGRWRAFSRATDGAGNVEAPFESQTSFTVAP